ncbi:AMP-dependent synthetase [Aeromicrobium sp. PE09-221]|uniref:AMP-binding protein n=1 Tax=Aeromicrobium sp. PE09-221 TaxID=1898043 RepID=UPI000B3ED338|nr:AMP-binding protein [Aeromicrobium sp. PE09-221]OUZ09426.1 AMP-dependent synthetase [Aeromicrobium sp. PE09-221]
MNHDSQSAVDEWLSVYGVEDADAAELLCDRHDPRAVAFTFVRPGDDGRICDVQTLRFGELADESRRLATVLHRRGVSPGDRVPVLLTKRRELIVALLALWRLGAVHVPLFTAFATGAVELRVRASGASLVITEPSQLAKIEPLDAVETLVVGEELDRLVAESGPWQDTVSIGGDGILVQLYTSGTTGPPKGVPVPLRALASFCSYMHYSVDLRGHDVYWNAADPGWAYGLYYAVIAPLALGRASVLVDAPFSPKTTHKVISELGVTNFCAAPTVYRALSRSGLFEGNRSLALRCASSAGEPLTPDVLEWSATALGTEVRDHYGQTELGMVICHHAHPDLREPPEPGSMGRPLPGFAMGIVDGEIAVDVPASPLMWFTGYQDDPEKTAERFDEDGRWYRTSDMGRRDDDGRYYFTARNDDVILAAGYRIGPFDVESVLSTHPAVADVAVVGRPDPEGIRGEVVEAFVVLTPGTQASAELEHELRSMVREQYSKHAYPRTIHVVEELPKTPSGKVQRYLLRRRQA